MAHIIINQLSKRLEDQQLSKKIKLAKKNSASYEKNINTINI